MGTRSTSLVILDEKIVLSQMCGMDGYFENVAEETWKYLKTCDLEKLTANLRKVSVETDEEKWEETFGGQHIQFYEALAAVEKGNLTIESNHDENFGSYRYILDLDRQKFTCETSCGYDANISETFDLDYDMETDICQYLDGIYRTQELNDLELLSRTPIGPVTDFLEQEITPAKLEKHYPNSNVRLFIYSNWINFQAEGEGGSAEYAYFKIQEDGSIILDRTGGSSDCIFTPADIGFVCSKEELVKEVLG